MRASKADCVCKPLSSGRRIPESPFPDPKAGSTMLQEFTKSAELTQSQLKPDSLEFLILPLDSKA